MLVSIVRQNDANRTRRVIVKKTNILLLKIKMILSKINIIKHYIDNIPVLSIILEQITYTSSQLSS